MWSATVTTICAVAESPVFMSLARAGTSNPPAARITARIRTDIMYLLALTLNGSNVLREVVLPELQPRIVALHVMEKVAPHGHVARPVRGRDLIAIDNVLDPGVGELTAISPGDRGQIRWLAFHRPGGGAVSAPVD